VPNWPVLAQVAGSDLSPDFRPGPQFIKAVVAEVGDGGVLYALFPYDKPDPLFAQPFLMLSLLARRAPPASLTVQHLEITRP
jgi:hypothetical protein